MFCHYAVKHAEHWFQRNRNCMTGNFRCDGPRLLVRIGALNGCTVYYDVGAFALVVAPGGDRFRVRVDGAEVSLTFIPPVVDLDFIAARRRP